MHANCRKFLKWITSFQINVSDQWGKNTPNPHHLMFPPFRAQRIHFAQLLYLSLCIERGHMVFRTRTAHRAFSQFGQWARAVGITH